MMSALISRLVVLVFGLLYPAYSSYKAVKTKDIKLYVKWMMYWIVFALFTAAETFTDIFISFWFPFYYELKVIIVIWLLSPVTKGSSIMYRRVIHPLFLRREQEIDKLIAKAKDQGYNVMLDIGSKCMSLATSAIMSTAVKGSTGLLFQLKKSYSLNDLSDNHHTYTDDGIVADHGQSSGSRINRNRGNTNSVYVNTHSDRHERSSNSRNASLENLFSEKNCRNSGQPNVRSRRTPRQDAQYLTTTGGVISQSSNVPPYTIPSYLSTSSSPCSLSCKSSYKNEPFLPTQRNAIYPWEAKNIPYELTELTVRKSLTKDTSAKSVGFMKNANSTPNIYLNGQPFDHTINTVPLIGKYYHNQTKPKALTVSRKKYRRKRRAPTPPSSLNRNNTSNTNQLKILVQSPASATQEDIVSKPVRRKLQVQRQRSNIQRLLSKSKELLTGLKHNEAVGVVCLEDKCWMQSDMVLAGSSDDTCTCSSVSTTTSSHNSVS